MNQKIIKTGEKARGDWLNKKRNIIIFIGIAFIAIACIFIYNQNTDKPILKSEYTIDEDGYIDDIAIKLTDVNYINNDTGIEVTFTLTNKRDNTITINPDDYFKFYDINMVQIPNRYTNNNNIIKKNETVSYKLQYDVTEKELYEIYFYSQIVENNIKFTFTAGDVGVDDISTIDRNNIIEDSNQ